MTLDDLLARLERRPNGCLEWTGYRNKRGYGWMTIAGRQWFTHRLTWELVHGPIPDGLYVCHRCDNPACCEPEHLFLGTQLDNIADMVSKGRQCKGKRRSEVARRTHAAMTPEQRSETARKGWITRRRNDLPR